MNSDFINNAISSQKIIVVQNEKRKLEISKNFNLNKDLIITFKTFINISLTPSFIPGYAIFEPEKCLTNYLNIQNNQLLLHKE